MYQTYSKAFNISKKVSNFQSILKRWTNFWSNWQKPIDVRVTSLEPRLVWCEKVIVRKKPKHWIKNKFFKNKTTNWEQGNWTVMFKLSLTAFNFRKSIKYSGRMSYILGASLIHFFRKQFHSKIYFPSTLWYWKYSLQQILHNDFTLGPTPNNFGDSKMT